MFISAQHEPRNRAENLRLSHKRIPPRSIDRRNRIQDKHPPEHGFKVHVGTGKRGKSQDLTKCRESENVCSFQKVKCSLHFPRE